MARSLLDDAVSYDTAARVDSQNAHSCPSLTWNGNRCLEVLPRESSGCRLLRARRSRATSEVALPVRRRLPEVPTPDSVAAPSRPRRSLRRPDGEGPQG